MRPTRRQESIFSVSAVDLFASALGAFLIVALVLFPYFPNTSDAPPATTPGVSPAEVAVLEAELAALRERIAELREELEDARQQASGAAADNARIAALEQDLEESRRRERELEQQLESGTSMKKLPPLDLVIALDTTGSMTNEITALREEIAGLADLLSHLTDDAALGIISFKDRCEPGGPIQTIPLQAVDSAGVSRLTAFARSLWPGGAGCNNTHPEAYAAALRAAVNSPWRSSSERRSIVMISDNPAYVEEQNRAVTEAGAFARQPGPRQTVSAVYVETGTPLRDTPIFMQRVASAGQGAYVQADQNASLSVTILLAVFRN